MGTQVVISVWAHADADLNPAFDSAFAEIHRLEVLMTSWPHPGWPPSDVMRVNAAAGSGMPVALAPETFTVLAAAQQMAQASSGAFDVTYAALRDVWRFDEDATGAVPTPEAIAQRQPWVDYRKLHLDASTQSAHLLHAQMRIDLGGIAKGFIVDAAVNQLRASGLRDFIVQAGGDMYVSGQRGDRPWAVGIRDPRGTNDNDTLATLLLRDHAFSTAGDYERAFIRDGQRYHHILDPRTGYPATACRSVTVYAPTALLADALDNTLFILGPTAGMALLKQYPGCEAVIVDAAGAVSASAGLRDKLKMQ